MRCLFIFTFFFFNEVVLDQKFRLCTQAWTGVKDVKLTKLNYSPFRASYPSKTPLSSTADLWLPWLPCQINI